MTKLQKRNIFILPIYIKIIMNGDVKYEIIKYKFNFNHKTFFKNYDYKFKIVGKESSKRFQNFIIDKYKISKKSINIEIDDFYHKNLNLYLNYPKIITIKFTDEDFINRRNELLKDILR